MVSSLWSVFLAAAPVGAAVLVLSDGASLEHWQGNPTLFHDGPAERAVVRYVVPPGTPHGPALSFSHSDVVLTADMALGFRYRFTGSGTSSLHVKLIDPDYSQGWQATWEIGRACAGDGRWRRGVVDLGSQWMKWGDRPVTEGRSIHFRTDGSPNSTLTLDLADVVFFTRRFDVKLLRSEMEGDTAMAVFGVTNRTDEALKLVLRSGESEVHAVLTAGEGRAIEFPVALDASRRCSLAPLEVLSIPVTVAARDAAWETHELAVEFTQPLRLPDRPRLLLRGDEVPALRGRIERLPWAAAIFAAEKRRADEWLGKAVELPPRGGQWWHWYACKADGSRLQTVSASEHRCPVCGRVYSGWPYDDVVLDRQHNALAGALRTLGLAYQVTSDRRYAEKGREILLAYAERYESYPLHNIHGKAAIGGGRVGPQTLDESTWLIPICQGADMIWETLSAEDRRRAEDGLFRPAAEVIRQHRMGIHNIQCWKNSAVGLVGLLLGDAALVADAVSSPHGFRRQVAQGITADGQWYEGAWGYHFYTVMAMVPLLEAGERCGLGLYGFEGEGRCARQLFEGPLDLAMPNLHLPAFNDSGTVNVRGQARWYECALGRYGTPRFAEPIGGERRGLEALLAGPDALPELPPDSRAGRNVTASGYAILEHGSGADAAWLCLKYGPHGGGHGHHDKLNLVAYRNGVLFGIDPGTAAYGVPIQKEWFRATLAHNTLTVDEANQAAAEGTCLAFGSAADAALSAVVAEAGPICERVVFRRAVALHGEDLILILDLVQAESEHTFDLAWHNAGTWVRPPSGTPAEVPAKPGYMHLRNMVRSESPLPVIRAGENLDVAIAVASADGVTWAGRGFHARDELRPAAVIHRCSGRTAVVGWALSLTGRTPELRVEGTPEHASLALPNAAGPVLLTVTPDATTVLTLKTAAGRLVLPAL
ncbi:MAG: alginate lyase family protein [Lentisphaeria bacterium]|nr:alginate lyase family protein [Lentisphaeria bacterium]